MGEFLIGKRSGSCKKIFDSGESNRRKSMKKCIVACAVASAIAFGVGTALFDGASQKVSAENIAPKKNIVRALEAGELLDTYQVDAKTYLPYPSDWGLKVGKTEQGYELVDNSGVARSHPGGAQLAAAMPLLKPVDAAVMEYAASCTVTGKARQDWGGFGMMFGWYNDSPLSVTYMENGSLSMAIDGNEWAQAVTVKEGAELAEWAEDATYKMKVSMSEGIASIFVNDVLINDVDLSDKEIIPAVGVSMKNYTAVYDDFTLEVPAEIQTPDDYKQEENLIVHTLGLLDTYQVDGAANHPYPNEWGMKVYEREGVFTRVNNSTEEFINDAFTAAYLPTSKKISGLENYYVEATVKPTVRSNWGGVGIVIGKGTAGNAENAPCVVWISEGDGKGGTNVCIAHSFKEFEVGIGVTDFAVNTEIKIGAVVNDGFVSVYINDILLGTADLSEAQIIPAVGVAYKNYNAEISGVTFKSAEASEAAVYTVTQISGGVEIGSFEYTYGSSTPLPGVERKGYTFMGWHFLPALNDGIVESLPNNAGGDVKVYCEYVVTNYSIRYFDGETELIDVSLEKNYDYKSYIGLPEIKKDGFTFDGWYETPDFSGEKIDAIQMGSTGDKVFFAKYTSNQEDGGCGSYNEISCIGMALAVCCVGASVLKKKRS